MYCEGKASCRRVQEALQRVLVSQPAQLADLYQQVTAGCTAPLRDEKVLACRFKCADHTRNPCRSTYFGLLRICITVFQLAWVGCERKCIEILRLLLVFTGAMLRQETVEVATGAIPQYLKPWTAKYYVLLPLHLIVHIQRQEIRERTQHKTPVWQCAVVPTITYLERCCTCL